MLWGRKAEFKAVEWMVAIFIRLTNSTALI